MKRLATLLLTLLLFAALPFAATAQDATPTGSPEAVASPEATVPTASIFVRESGTLGRYLSTPDGRTLYVTDGDTVANESTCVGDCAIAWIPFSSEEPLSLPADVTGELTLFEREDGATQLAYNGMPLYTYNADAAPGDTLGAGVGGVWWLAAPGDQLGVPATPVAPTAVDMGTPRASGPVTVSMREYYIQSAAVTFATDVEYTFNITNFGDAEHQFVIEAAGSQGEAISEVTTIAPGESATLVVAFTEAGNFQLASHAGTDYEQGMSLNITVV